MLLFFFTNHSFFLRNHPFFIQIFRSFYTNQLLCLSRRDHRLRTGCHWPRAFYLKIRTTLYKLDSPKTAFFLVWNLFQKWKILWFWFEHSKIVNQLTLQYSQNLQYISKKSSNSILVKIRENIHPHSTLASLGGRSIVFEDHPPPRIMMVASHKFSKFLIQPILGGGRGGRGWGDA